MDGHIDKYKNNKPKNGETIFYKGKDFGVVTSVEGALCWVQRHDETKSEPFIWCFKDGLNNLHDWSSKNN